MNINSVIVVSLILVGCSHGTTTKRAPEVVASCFSDGDNQDLFCKTTRINEESKVVTTRCIGSTNKIAVAALRGKCVEKICIEGSQTECTTRGEFAVLQQYAELVKGRLFAEDEAGPSQDRKANKTKRAKGKKVAAIKAEPADIDTDPSVRLPPEPEKEELAPPPVPLVKASPAVPAEPPQMNVVLRPANQPSAKARVPASTPRASLEGFKRICVSKTDTAAPMNLRGKCAVRTCSAGKCTYQGRKEMFDWAAR